MENTLRYFLFQSQRSFLSSATVRKWLYKWCRKKATTQTPSPTCSTKCPVQKQNWNCQCKSAVGSVSTCGSPPVSIFRWLVTLLDFLLMEWIFSRENFSLRVSSSSFLLYFSTADREFHNTNNLYSQGFSQGWAHKYETIWEQTFWCHL